MSRRRGLRTGRCLAKPARVTFLCLLLQTGLGVGGDTRPAGAQEVPSARVERSLDHAQRLLRAGRVEEAGRVLESLLEEHPTSTAALWLLFDVTGELGEPEVFLSYITAAARRTGTGEAALQELWVRALLRSDRANEARVIAERWLEEKKNEPRAYAVLGAVHTAAGRPSQAIESLERGRRQLGDRTLFRAELAALYAKVGRFETLVAEWLARLSERPADLAAVHREISALESPADAIEALWSAAGNANREPETRHSVALLALRLGSAGPARRIASLALQAMPPDRAAIALAAYVREAEEAGLVGEAAWGAMQLTDVAASPRERWRWLALAGERALEAGDTASARTSAERLVAEAPSESEPATLGLERLIRLLAARSSSVDAAGRQLETYIRAYPDSSMRIARLTLAVARGQVLADRHVAAGELLRKAPVGEGTARHVLDAALAELEIQRGEQAEARRLLRTAATAEGVAHEWRTRWISLLAVLETADSLEVAWLGRALGVVSAAPAATTALDPTVSLESWIGSPAGKGRAVALAYLAGELEATGRADAAVVVHDAIVRNFPDSPEAAAAMLALARHSLVNDAVRSRAWLERLVTRFPDSAVAPLARRMLTELSGHASTGSQGD